MSRGLSKRIKRFDVFDFADEDERVERESAELLARFKNPKRARKASSPVNKYNFLQCFARQNDISNRPIDLDVEDCSRNKQMDVSNVPIELDSEVTEPQSTRKNGISDRLIDLDIEVADCGRTKQKEVSNGPIELDSELTELQFLQSHKTWKKIDGPIDVDAKEEQATKTAQKLSISKFGDINARVTGQQCTFPAYCPVKMRQEEISELDTSLQYFSSSYKNERVGMISDDDDRIEISSSSAFASSHVECGDSPEEQLSVHGSEGNEIETENMKVVISPDFMFYGGMYCTEGQLTFSKTCLKFEGLTVNETKEKFSFVWIVGDIISIDAQWIERVETAIMNLVLQSQNSNRAGNANETSAIGLLKFSVCDPCWSERQEAIKSLSVRYKDIWNEISDFHEHFVEVIYPKGDPDAISVSKRDVALLQPETFINDTIIDFYIKYLKNKIQPEEQHRFHFFNSFFFRKLADLDKDLSNGCQARAAFQRVHKWTRKVDIFEKDYIFIPVNYSLHWSLIVICRPGEVANFEDNETEKLLNVPCILHMNSIRGSHRGLKNLFQSYLSEEWKERHREAEDDVPSNFLHLQFVSLELPQQENSFDCGLFLLHYMELFLLQASTNFCPLKLNRYWFPPAEASLKRSHIKKLIYEILKEQSCGSTSADSIYKYPSSLSPFRTEQENGAQIGSSAKLYNGHSSNSNVHRHSSNSNVKQGPNDFALSAVSPQLVLQGCKDSGLESFKFYEVGTTGGSLSHGNYQQTNTLSKRNAMSPIEEIEETSEEIAADLPSDLGGQQVAGPVTEPCLNMRYPSKYCRLRTSWNQEKPLHFEDSDFIKSNDSLDSSEIGLQDDQLLPEFEMSSRREESDKPEFSSTSNEGYSYCIVEDSQELNGIHDDVEFESTYSPSSFPRDISTLSHQEANLTAKVDHNKNTMPISNGDHVSV